jgi:type II secretory pathway pseudopilin PulG
MTRRAFAKIESATVQPGARSGFSLLELLLVLGILVAVVGFSVPAIQDANDVRRLDEAGELVRQALSDGRVKAIETGLIYQFRYEPGAAQFVVVPDPSELSGTQDGSEYFRISGQLGEDYEFRETLDSPGSGESLDIEWFKGMENAGELAGASWSDPVEFSFEGTAKDAFVYILDEQKRSIRVRIRGLTGSVTVGNVSREAMGQ